MTNHQNSKQYDLEERTLLVAKRVHTYIQKLPKHVVNIENGKQLVRSAGSIGANYIEANEALGKKDFIMRLRIARKEAKETRFWIELTQPNGAEASEKEALKDESNQLLKNFERNYRKKHSIP